ncbi:hypothetical protein Plhal304r1_c031g0100341 [Plasmopara halstedii]
MNSMSNHPKFLHFLLFASVAIVACTEPDIADTLTVNAKPLESIEERIGPVPGEAQAGWFVRFFRAIWGKIARTWLVKWLNPSLHMKYAKDPVVVATNLFHDYGLGSVKENLFVSEPFKRWSGVINDVYKDEPKKGYNIMVEVLANQDTNKLIDSMIQTETSLDSTPLIKGIKTAILDKAFRDNKLENVFENNIIQKWYRSSKKAVVEEIVSKVRSDVQLIVDSTMIDTSTFNGDAKAISEDVMAILEDIQDDLILGHAKKFFGNALLPTPEDKEKFMLGKSHASPTQIDKNNLNTPIIAPVSSMHSSIPKTNDLKRYPFNPVLEQETPFIILFLHSNGYDPYREMVNQWVNQYGIQRTLDYIHEAEQVSDEEYITLLANAASKHFENKKDNVPAFRGSPDAIPPDMTPVGGAPSDKPLSPPVDQPLPPPGDKPLAPHHQHHSGQ